MMWIEAKAGGVEGVAGGRLKGVCLCYTFESR